MASEAQRKANKNYRQRIMEKGIFKRILLEFYPTELDLYEWVQSQEGPKATYIKELIRKDMAR